MSPLMRVRPDGTRDFLRFPLSQRVEHVIAIVSFTALCATGLPQRFASFPHARTWISWLGGIDLTRKMHRAAALLLMTQLVVHVALRLLSLLQGRNLGAIVPLPRDLLDAVRMGLFLVGFRKARPRFDRYDFKQKFEYWAMVWGTVVMIATGLALWFPVTATRILPGVMIPVARIVHGGEALLAFVTIAVWHMYCAVFGPEVFPLDASMFTGRISEKRMLHEHPLEHERLVRELGLAPVEPPPEADDSQLPTAPTESEWTDVPVAAYRELALSIGPHLGLAAGPSDVPVSEPPPHASPSRLLVTLPSPRMTLTSISLAEPRSPAGREGPQGSGRGPVLRPLPAPPARKPRARDIGRLTIRPETPAHPLPERPSRQRDPVMLSSSCLVEDADSAEERAAPRPRGRGHESRGSMRSIRDTEPCDMRGLYDSVQ